MGRNRLIANNSHLLIDADTSDAYCKTTRVENEPKLKWRFYHGCIDECLILKFYRHVELDSTRRASTTSVKSKLFLYYLPREICFKNIAFNLNFALITLKLLVAPQKKKKKQCLRKKNASTKTNLERFFF